MERPIRIHSAFRLGLIGTLGVGVGIAILTAIANLSTVFTYVGAALFLALGLEPAIGWLERRGVRRWVALLIVTFAVLLGAAGLLLAVIPIIVDQVTQLFAKIPQLVDSLSSQDWLSHTLDGWQSQFPLLDVHGLWNGISTGITDFFSNPDKLSEVAGGVLQAGVAIASGAFAAIVVIILTLYFTASMTNIKHGISALVPASRRERFSDLTEQITTSVGSFVIGQVTLAAINGILSFCYLSFINAPFPAVLALIAFVGSLIPLVGTLTASAVIVLTCLLPEISSPITALAAGIYYVIYMQVEAYVLSPRIMTRAVKVPGAVVVVAALAGGALLGILGALIAIPLAASVLIILKQVVVPHQERS